MLAPWSHFDLIFGMAQLWRNGVSATLNYNGRANSDILFFWCEDILHKERIQGITTGPNWLNHCNRTLWWKASRKYCGASLLTNRPVATTLCVFILLPILSPQTVFETAGSIKTYYVFELARVRTSKLKLDRTLQF